MRKHLLVTVSEDQSALYGLRFVGRLFADPSGVDVTLFYTALRPACLSGLPNYEERVEQDKLMHQQQIKGRKALDKARNILARTYGFPMENIQTLLRFRRLSKAVDIIAEGERGQYDAVVLGKRGVSRLQELMRDSLSHELLNIRMTIPLWICRPEGDYRRNILLCVDGSGPSMRMADHVGFMMADQKQHRIQVYHVWDPALENRLEADDVVDQAVDMLVRNGVPHERIDRHVDRSAGFGRKILEKAENGLYSVVATGRTGERGSLFERLFMGSVSLRLLRNLQSATLWVSH